jgi:ACS family allantoate permease-like MFS transporter
MFIIFGGITVLFGITLWWLLPDSPVTAGWLTPRERVVAVERLKSNRTGVKNTVHKGSQIKEALLDPKVWMLVLAVFFHNMTNSLQSTFTGLILKGFGYSTYQAVLLSIPPGVIMAASTLLVSFLLATKWGEGKRIFMIILCYVPGVIACGLLYLPGDASTLTARLGAVFIVAMVATSAGVTYSLLASNVAGYTKKTIAGSLFFSAYCVANIISPQTFITAEAPRYETGITVALAAFSFNIVLFASLYIVYSRANAARDRDRPTDDDLVNAFSDLTDLENKRFRYKL